MLFQKNIPADGLAGLQQNWKNDLSSGFLVFLIALPLCLGISLASGFPPIAGIFTAIIGGMVVSVFAGSKLTIKGPAAGLIAIAVGAIDTFSKYNTPDDRMMAYKLTLAVIVVASVLQVIFGLVKAGRYGDFFPASVIHGMLAAIGIIIFAKQFPVLMGVKPQSKEPLELLAEIPQMLKEMNPEIFLIGGVSLLILFILPLIKNKLIKMIPAPMLVLVFAVLMGFYFDLLHEHKYMFLGHEYHLGENFLVTLPDNILDGITFPVFTHIFTLDSIQFILMFSLVGSIESLLTVKAIDGLDPYQRKSDMNRDLVAVGAGNILAGLIGGLPMISEVVRSSANVNNGARTRWANFFHGIFLLIFVAFFPGLIHQIPLAALAAMLVYTGYRLASPKEFKNTYQIGAEQLVIFLTTLIITLATDLLLGVFAGIVLKILIHIIGGANPLRIFKAKAELSHKHETYCLNISNYAIFSNFLGYKKYLAQIPAGSHVIINFEQAWYVDHTFMEHIHHFEHDHHLTGGTVELEGLENHKPFSDHPLAARKIRKNAQGKSKEISLNNRQKALQKVADQLGCSKFNPNLAYDSMRMIHFSFFQGKKVKYLENRLIKEIKGATLEFTDLLVTEGARTSETRYKTSVLFVSHLHDHFPDFRIEKEGFWDKFFGGSDINFEQYPVFSKKYLLRGADEQAIKAFFDEELIRFFEKHHDFLVETKGDKILIHRDKGLTPPKLVTEEFKFAEELFSIIHKSCLSQMDYLQSESKKNHPVNSPLANSLDGQSNIEQ
ncbi:MAG: SulP family inorganic anion transporter [Microscillaceae bacterium]|nr:SulP family inorganic anion transporter [Microscillaceae bacterium]